MSNDQLAISPVYQKILQEGSQEGELKGLRKAVLAVVEERFAELAPLAKKQLDLVTDQALLVRLNVKMSTAQTIQEAAQPLIAIGAEEKKN